MYVALQAKFFTKYKQIKLLLLTKRAFCYALIQTRKYPLLTKAILEMQKKKNLFQRLKGEQLCLKYFYFNVYFNLLSTNSYNSVLLNKGK